MVSAAYSARSRSIATSAGPDRDARRGGLVDAQGADRSGPRATSGTITDRRSGMRS